MGVLRLEVVKVEGLGRPPAWLDSALEMGTKRNPFVVVQVAGLGGGQDLDCCPGGEQ